MSRAEEKRQRTLDLFEELKSGLAGNVVGADQPIWELVHNVAERNWDSVDDCFPRVKAAFCQSLAVKEFTDRLGRIEASVDALATRQTIQDWYDTEQIAKILGKDAYTVREWCRLGRIKCDKRRSGRGRHHAWVISHAELERIQKEGLLPFRRV